MLNVFPELSKYVFDCETTQISKQYEETKNVRKYDYLLSTSLYSLYCLMVDKMMKRIL